MWNIRQRMDNKFCCCPSTLADEARRDLFSSRLGGAGLRTDAVFSSPLHSALRLDKLADLRIGGKLLTSWQKRKFEKFLNWIFLDKQDLTIPYCIELLVGGGTQHLPEHSSLKPICFAANGFHFKLLLSIIMEIWINKTLQRMELVLLLFPSKAYIACPVFAEFSSIWQNCNLASELFNLSSFYNNSSKFKIRKVVVCSISICVCKVCAEEEGRGEGGRNEVYMK